MLVECEPQRNGISAPTQQMNLEQAHRTGSFAHLRHRVFEREFNVTIAADQPLVFVEPDVIDRLRSMVARLE